MADWSCEISIFRPKWIILVYTSPPSGPFTANHSLYLLPVRGIVGIAIYNMNVQTGNVLRNPTKGGAPGYVYMQHVS